MGNFAVSFIQIQAFTSANMPSEIMDVVFDGIQFDQPQDLSDFSLDLLAVAPLSMAYGRQLQIPAIADKVERFYAGAGLNVLLGLTDIHLASNKLMLSTTSDSIFIEGEQTLGTNIKNLRVDIVNNTFTNSIFENLGYGVVWGRGTNLGNVAMATGPINNAITNSRFANIDKNGFWVKEGYGNVSANNSYALVGNDGGTENGPISGVIKFESKNNSSHTDHFTRTKVLSSDTANLSNVAYIPEIEGKFAGTFSYTFDASVGYVPVSYTHLTLPTKA